MDVVFYYFICVISYGMGVELVIFDWFVLILVEVMCVLCYYFDVGQLLWLEWYSLCLFLVVCVMQIESGFIIVKCYYVCVCDVVVLVEEYCFVVYLQVCGLLVSSVLVIVEGVIVLVDDYWIYEVFLLVLGVDLYCEVMLWMFFISCIYVYLVGQMLVCLYQVLVGYDVLVCLV